MADISPHGGFGFLVERAAAWDASLNQTLQDPAARVTEINERLTTLEREVHE